jgi:hypothetical protein
MEISKWIDFDHMDEPQPFFCPFCGSQLLTPALVENPCEHLMFSWLNEVPEFEKASAATLEVLKKLRQEDEDFDDDPRNEQFLNAMPPNTILISFTESPLSGLTLVLGLCPQWEE